MRTAVLLLCVLLLPLQAAAQATQTPTDAPQDLQKLPIPAWGQAVIDSFSKPVHPVVGGVASGGGLGFGLLKEGLQAYLMQRLAPDPKVLDAARLLYLSTRAGAEALGLEHQTGDFQAGKAADFVYLQPPAGSVLDAAVQRADDPAQALAAMFTLGGSESVREVRVEGDIVYALEA